MVVGKPSFSLGKLKGALNARSQAAADEESEEEAPQQAFPQRGGYDVDIDAPPEGSQEKPKKNFLKGFKAPAWKKASGDRNQKYLDEEGPVAPKISLAQRAAEYFAEISGYKDYAFRHPEYISSSFNEHWLPDRDSLVGRLDEQERDQKRGQEGYDMEEDSYIDSEDEYGESETVVTESGTEYSDAPIVQERPISAGSAASVDLMDVVREVYPQINTMAQQQAATERYIRGRLHKMRSFNLPLMRAPMGAAPKRASRGVTGAPPLLVVGGHDIPGNRTINGVYEIIPGAFHGRPWYRKALESHPGPSVKLAGKVHYPEYSRKVQPLKDFEDPSTCYVTPAQDQKYIYFDDRLGRWCIGSKPGGKAVFAKCADAEAFAPHRLTDWEVWNAKVNDWYFHPTMYCERAAS